VNKGFEFSWHTFFKQRMHDVFIQGEVAEAATMPNICEPNIF